MHKIIQHTLTLSLFTFVYVAGSACSAPAVNETGTGELSLPLRSDLDGATYELRNATFSITGETETVLQTETGSDASSLETELPTGDYGIELAPDWQLFRLNPDGDEPLPAVLISDNPTSFSIVEAETTSVSFRFEVEGEEIDLATGLLELTIDVVSKPRRALVFTEIMSNPAAIGDSDGEWLELYNAGSDALELQGCTVERDASAFTIDGKLSVEPGQVVTFANSDTPGFTPSYVYSSVTLPNSAVFVLTVRCGDEILDSVTVDPSVWPGASGVAASLDVDTTQATDNDAASAWCNAVTAYNGDLGTPGVINPSCALP